MKTVIIQSELVSKVSLRVSIARKKKEGPFFTLPSSVILLNLFAMAW